MGLRAYIIKRIIYSIILVLFVLVLNFAIFELMPGDPTKSFISPTKYTQAQRESARAHWGLDKPFHEKLFAYMINMLTWQFGDSFMTRRAVADEIMFYLPNTIQLLGLSTIFAIIIGVILGAIAAHRRGGIFDTASVTSSLITFSLPTFWMGMLFLVVFSSQLHWFPVGKAFPSEWVTRPEGWPTPLLQFNLFGVQITIPGFEEIITRLHHIALPLITLTLFSYGGFLLLTRAAVLETLTEDYVLTARAKGLKERTVLFKHALKNASLPIITNAGLSLSFILSGAIITETVYSWPGLGHWTWNAIQSLDYPVLQAMFFITALCVIIANFIIDLLYGVIDPRIKYG